MSMVRQARTRVTAVAIVVATLLVGCAGTERNEAPSPFPSDGPRLLLLIVVDQLGQEYLTRFRPLLQGGLAYLLDNGAVFTDAHHEHAHTVTGAGHATLATGCFPRHNGIIANQWHARDTGESVYCVQGTEHARAPDNLLVATIGDWLDAMDARAKVFAASGKDRSAILLGGQRADAALWYAGGEFVTSGYYRQPPWLEEFNDAGWTEQYFGTLWEPLPVEPAVLEALDIVTLDEGIYQRAFPYPLGSAGLQPDGSFHSAVLSSPLSDRYLVELARTMIRAEGLGADEHPDLLALGFSALDYVGHAFGPNSREVLDTILRLDAGLAELFELVDREVGLERVVIALSSDHGVAPLPEFRQLRGEWGERIGTADIACFQRVGRALRERYGGELLRVGLYLDDDAIAAAGLERDALEGEVAEMLADCPSVQRVWTRSELLATPAGRPSGDEAERYRQLFANGYHPERSADFEIQFAPYYVDRGGAGTTHGSPHDYDSRVPMIVVAPGLAPRTIETRVSTIDLAPTLAEIMGISPPANIDGESRPELQGDR